MDGDLVPAGVLEDDDGTAGALGVALGVGLPLDRQRGGRGGEDGDGEIAPVADGLVALLVGHAFEVVAVAIGQRGDGGVERPFGEQVLWSGGHGQQYGDAGADSLERVPPVRLLFVCLGNICRSPTAEGVMRHLLETEDLTERVEIDSAGTGDWHVGESPDARSVEAARGRGVTLAGAARQVTVADFEAWDLLLCADRRNAAVLLALAPDAAAAEKVRLLREFDPDSVAAGRVDVPDPYFGEDGFEEVLDIVEAACAGLLEHLQRRREGARR